jgi:NitT/TauT family transport system permease protein
LGAGDGQILYHVILPAVWPTLLTALRLSIGTAIAVLFFAETFVTYQGLGYYIMDAWTMLDYEQMFLGIVGLSLLGLVFFVMVDMVERWLVRWK